MQSVRKILCESRKSIKKMMFSATALVHWKLMQLTEKGMSAYVYLQYIGWEELQDGGRERLCLWLCNAGAVGELWAEQLRHAHTQSQSTRYRQSETQECAGETESSSLLKTCLDTINHFVTPLLPILFFFSYSCPFFSWVVAKNKSPAESLCLRIGMNV